MTVTQIGTSEGIKAGDAFPAAVDRLSGVYFLCVVAGSAMTVPDLNGKTHNLGDWSLCISAAQGWELIDLATGGGGGGATKLSDLTDVDLNSGGPFAIGDVGAEPRMALEDKQYLKYDSSMGVCATLIWDGGTFEVLK